VALNVRCGYATEWLRDWRIMWLYQNLRLLCQVSFEEVSNITRIAVSGRDSNLGVFLKWAGFATTVSQC